MSSAPAGTPAEESPAPAGAVSAAEVAAMRGSLSTLRGVGGAAGWQLFFTEARPLEGGRQVVRMLSGPEKGAVDLGGPTLNVRSRVHEYGGAAFSPLVAPGLEEATALAVVEAQSQRIWRLELSGPEARPLTEAAPEGELVAHGDLVDLGAAPYVLAVAEHHARGERPRRRLVAAAADPGPSQRADQAVLFEGTDFVAAPRPGPACAGGRWLAWITWDHPSMPWDASSLWLGRLRLGPGGRLSLEDAQVVAGGPGSSVGQPTWCGEDLFFAWDRGGFWQPWAVSLAGSLRCLSHLEAEFESPQWALGQCAMAALDDERVACRWRRSGTDHLGILELGGRQLVAIDQPCVAVSGLCAGSFGLAWLGTTPASPQGLWWLERPGDPTSPRRRLAGPAAPSWATRARAGEHLEVGRGGVRLPVTFHRPWPRSETEPGGPPPLIVSCHGGPTGSSEPGFNPVVQFFLSRGFAVAEVDYRGSSGYGREFRQALAGRWGVADAEDCVAAADALAASGLVDRGRLVIRGSSAGGLTALNALVLGRSFAAATSWYGVTDLEALAASTHDFEVHYSDRLIGPLPQFAEEYRRRSPRWRAGDLVGAVLLLQGTDDPVVPLAQAESLAESLSALGRPCRLVTFPGEGHGFKQAATIEAGLRTEAAFYEEVLGLREPRGP